MAKPYQFDRYRAGHLQLLVGWLIVLLSISSAQAQTPSQGRQITLRQQLTAGLKATRPADFAFINRVILAVEQGRLPRKLVDTTFLWSRDRAARRSYTRRLRPIVYFQPALTLRARRIGVIL